MATDTPKTLRHGILHAARLTRSGHQRRLKIPITSPWAQQLIR